VLHQSSPSVPCGGPVSFGRHKTGSLPPQFLKISSNSKRMECTEASIFSSYRTLSSLVDIYPGD
jgi:hypothetical protein